MNANYDMINFTKPPGNYLYLSELLGLFKDKLGFANMDCPPVTVSIRMTHLLGEWPKEWLFADNPFDPDDPPLDVVQSIDLVAYQDPISELQLSTSWPSLSEELVADSPFHSDLDPLNAPKWSVRLVARDNSCSTAMYDLMSGFYNLSNHPNKNLQILGKLIEDLEDRDNDLEVRQALDRMSNPNLSMTLPQIGPVRPSSKWKMPESVRDTLIKYIFETFREEVEEDDVHELLKETRSYKSCPYNGLTWRMILALAYVNATYKDLASVAYIWREIISELRSYWEKCSPLPGYVQC